MLKKTLYPWMAGLALMLGLSGTITAQYTPAQIQALEQAKKAKVQAGQNTPKSDKNIQPEQDCPDAITICQDVYVQTFSYSGTGYMPNEINPAISCLDGGEQNDVWYIFTALNTGILNFTITPLNPADDYDWAVFDLTGHSCPEIYVDPSLQVGCNFSAIPGPTGANNDTTGHPQNELAIPVTAGHTFVINVSNFSATQSGYTLDFSAGTVELYDTIPPVADSATYVCNNYGVRIYFNELISCATIATDGSDFFATNSAGSPVAVIGAVGVECSPSHKYTNYIDVMIAGQTQNETITVGVKEGSDGNSIGDKCLNMMTTMSISALVGPQPVVNLGEDLKLCPVDLYYPVLDAGVSDAVYSWYRNGISLADSTQSYQPSSPGQYSVIVFKDITVDPCVLSDTLNVDIAMDYCIDNMPNAFSPNGDGYNDILLNGVDVAIVNRWGQTMFVGNTGWDGTVNGENASNGTYYAIVKFYNSGGELITLKYPVTLVR